QVRRHVRGASGAGLAVLHDDLDRTILLLEEVSHPGDHESVGRRKRSERAGLRANIADLDRTGRADARSGEVREHRRADYNPARLNDLSPARQDCCTRSVVALLATHERVLRLQFSISEGPTPRSDWQERLRSRTLVRHSPADPAVKPADPPEDPGEICRDSRRRCRSSLDGDLPYSNRATTVQ